jgi:hypothetical protein
MPRIWATLDAVRHDAPAAQEGHQEHVHDPEACDLCGQLWSNGLSAQPAPAAPEGLPAERAKEEDQ